MPFRTASGTFGRRPAAPHRPRDYGPADPPQRSRPAGVCRPPLSGMRHAGLRARDEARPLAGPDCPSTGTRRHGDLEDPAKEKSVRQQPPIPMPSLACSRREGSLCPPARLSRPSAGSCRSQRPRVHPRFGDAPPWPVVTNPFPRPPGSDTIPIALRPAVHFNPFGPAGLLPPSPA